MQVAPADTEFIRQGWADALATLAPGRTELAAMVETRLDDALLHEAVDEPTLLGIAAEAAELARQLIDPSAAATLERRLKRSVYEYLLSIDASEELEDIAPAQPAVTTVSPRLPVVVLPDREPEATAAEAPEGGPEVEVPEPVLGPVELHVAEAAADDADEGPAGPAATEADVQLTAARSAADIAENEPEAADFIALDAAPSDAESFESEPPDAEPIGRGFPPLPTIPHDEPVDAATPVEDEPVTIALALPAIPEALDVAVEASGSTVEPPVFAGSGPVEPPAAAAAAELSAEPPTGAPAELAEEGPPSGAVSPEPSAEPANGDRPGRRARFLVFRRNGSVSPMDETETPAATAPPEPPLAPEPPAYVPEPVRPAPPPIQLNTFVAPRDGFHLVDHVDYEEVMAELEQTAAEAAALEAGDPGMDDEEPPESGEHRGTTPRGWRVRSFRANRRRAPDFAGDHTEPEPEAEDDAAQSEDEETPAHVAFNNDPQAIAIRRQVSERLRKRKCDEAAALVQRLSADFGGRPVAELGLDAGDRCRALGKSNAALSCYLAASRADPVYDEPLLRLADICIADRDIDLAVSYLERVARLHRLRSDLKGALRVYRKIATIAPNRTDILSVLMRAQATGRFED